MNDFLMVLFVIAVALFVMEERKCADEHDVVRCTIAMVPVE